MQWPFMARVNDLSKCMLINYTIYQYSLEFYFSLDAKFAKMKLICKLFFIRVCYLLQFKKFDLSHIKFWIVRLKMREKRLKWKYSGYMVNGFKKKIISYKLITYIPQQGLPVHLAMASYNLQIVPTFPHQQVTPGV